MKLSQWQACAGRSAVLEVLSVKHQQIYRKVLSHRLHTELCSNPLRLPVLSFCLSHSVEVRHPPKGHTRVTSNPQQRLRMKADSSPAFVALKQTGRVISHRQKRSVKLIKSAHRVQMISGDNSSKQMQPRTYQVRERSVHQTVCTYAVFIVQYYNI